MNNQSNEPVLGSAILTGANAVLVKFTFSKPENIPVGLKKKWRASDYRVDVAHAEAAEDAGQSELSAIGRVRNNRIDTGEQVIVLPSAQIALLRAGLRLQGFPLTDAFWQERKRTGKKSQYILTCAFGHGGKAMAASEELTAALQSLSNDASWTAYVWQNPDKTITVNCNSRQLAVAPKHALVVRKGTIAVREVATNLTEGQEAE
jgi:hypothetical protein